MPSSVSGTLSEPAPTVIPFSRSDKKRWLWRWVEATNFARKKGGSAFRGAAVDTATEDLPFKEDGFVVVVGDVGTADDRQQEVMTKIREQLEKLGAKLEEVVVIHLGDIYYYGMPDECKAFWNVRARRVCLTFITSLTRCIVTETRCEWTQQVQGLPSSRKSRVCEWRLGA